MAFALFAVTAWLVPSLREAMLYDRALLRAGQWWRLWLGHFAHHGGNHLFWNLVVFLPAGMWLERKYSGAARIFLLAVPIFISGCLLRFEPSLEYYAGLSGVTMGVLTLLALLQLRPNSGEPRWIWSAVLLLIAGKIVAEFLRPPTALFAALPGDVRNVPWAHLGGAIAAGLAFVAVVATKMTPPENKTDGSA